VFLPDIIFAFNAFYVVSLDFSLSNPLRIGNTRCVPFYSLLVFSSLGSRATSRFSRILSTSSPGVLSHSIDARSPHLPTHLHLMLSDIAPLSESTRSPSGAFNSEKLRMAFNFGASNPAGGSASAELGPELPDVCTDVCLPHHSSHSP
jgi:hypothetical protein